MDTMVSDEMPAGGGPFGVITVASGRAGAGATAVARGIEVELLAMLVAEFESTCLAPFRCLVSAFCELLIPVRVPPNAEEPVPFETPAPREDEDPAVEIDPVGAPDAFAFTPEVPEEALVPLAEPVPVLVEDEVPLACEEPLAAVVEEPPEVVAAEPVTAPAFESGPDALAVEG